MDRPGPRSGVLRVEAKDGWHTKNYKPRTIPINGTLRKLLGDLPRRGRLLFDDGGGQFVMWPESLSRAFRQAAKRAKIAGITLHTLRHTFASHLVMAGTDLRTVQVLLGHQSVITTQIYAHLAPDHLRSATERLDF